MISKTIASELYLDLLVFWEKEAKNLPKTGYFDIRRKKFQDYKRAVNLKVIVMKNSQLSNDTIESYKINTQIPEQIVVFSKGDSSSARSLFRHLRNSIAHAHIEVKKISKCNYLIFSAKNTKGKNILFAKLKQSEIKSFISAIKSTIKYN